MSDVSISHSTVERFIDRIYPAFIEGGGTRLLNPAGAANVLRLQEAYRSLAAGDFAPMIAQMAEAIELDLCGAAGVPILGRWRGRADVVSAMVRNYGLLAEQQAEILAVIAQGSMLALLAEERGVVRASGSPYHWRWSKWFTILNGEITQVKGIVAPAMPAEL